MTANRTVRRTLGGLSAVAVLAGAALVVLSPPPGAALSAPGVYGLVLLGAATGLLVALATIAVAGPPPADKATPAPAGAEPGDAEPAEDAVPAPDGAGEPTPGAAAEVGTDSTPPPAADIVGTAAESGTDATGEEATETDSIDSVQELFEQVADEEPPRSLVDEDAAEGGFLFGGDRDRE